MDDFTKNIKQILEDRVEPKPSTSNWNDLMWRMTGKKSNSPFPVLFSFLGGAAISALIILYLTGNYPLGSTDYNLQREMNKKAIQTDTLFLEKIVHSIDTVFMNKQVDKAITQNNYGAHLTNHQNHHPLHLTPMNIPASFASDENIYSSIDDLQQNLALLRRNYKSYSTTTGKNTLGKENIEPDQAYVSILETLSLPVNSLNDQHAFPAVVENKVSLEEEKWPVRIGRSFNIYRIDLSLGVDQSFSTDELLQSGIATGAVVQSKIHFQNKAFLYARLNYYTQNWSSDELPSDSNNYYPAVTPPEPSYSFQSIEMTLKSLSSTIGLGYQYHHGGNWESYVGMGYTVLALFPYELVYDFKDDQTNLELGIFREFERTKFYHEMIDLSLGSQYRFNSNYFVNLGLSYQKRLKSHGLPINNRFAFHLGLGRMF